MALCVLCFGETRLKQDKNRVFGQSAFPVAQELLSLEFELDIKNAQYICRSCVQLLKRRRGILNNLNRINCIIQEKHNAKPYTSQCVDIISVPVLSTPTKKVILDTNSPVDNDNLYSRDGFEYSSNLLQSKASTPLKRKSNPPITRTVAPVIFGCQTQQQTHGEKIVRNTRIEKTSVEVIVHWPSKTKVNKLDDSLESLGKMLCRGTYKQIAAAVWKSPIPKKHCTQLFLKDVDKECRTLCSSKSGSCLRSPTKKQIEEFSFDTLIKELKTNAPLLSGVLWTASLQKRSRSEDDNSLWKRSVCMSAAVVLKNRSPSINALQLINILSLSTILEQL